MIVDKINKYLSEQNFPELDENILNSVAEESAYIFNRQFGVREEREGGLYLSSIGKCLRQQAYRLHNYPTNGKEIDSRALMVFYQGDMAELAVVFLAKLSGVIIKDQQKRLLLNGVFGHPDGVIVGEDKDRLLEVKSMSSYSFDNFTKGEIDASYIYQFNSYMEALGLDETVMVALNKDNGVLGERVFLKNNDVVRAIKNRIGILQTSAKEILPEPEYTFDEKGFYPWQCLYCSYHKHCHPNADKVLVSKRYKLKEIK